MDGFAEVLTALGGWTQVGAGTLLVLVIIAILRGLLIPKGLVPREEVEAALAEVRRVAEARVTDAQRVADKAGEDARVWREAWIAAEGGRSLAADQTRALLEGMAKLAELLQSAASRAPRSTPPK